MSRIFLGSEDITSRIAWPPPERDFFDASVWGDTTGSFTVNFDPAADWWPFRLTDRTIAQMFLIAMRRKRQRPKYPSDGGRRR